MLGENSEENPSLNYLKILQSYGLHFAFHICAGRAVVSSVLCTVESGCSALSFYFSVSLIGSPWYFSVEFPPEPLLHSPLSLLRPGGGT